MTTSFLRKAALVFVLLILIGIGVAWISKPRLNESSIASHTIVVTTPVLQLFASQLVKGVPGVSVQRVFETEGHCLHDHQVSAQEMRVLCSAKLVLANGVGFEPFLQKAMAQCPRVPVVNVGDGCADFLLKDSIVDPHVWLGRGAVCEVRALVRALSSRDQANSMQYLQSGKNLGESIDAAWDSASLQGAPLRGSAVVSFHGAFNYFARELGLNVVASFGEDAESPNPSAQQIAGLIQVIREKKVKALLLGLDESPALAESVSRETGVKILRMDNMLGPFAQGDSSAYARVLLQNVKILVDSLSQVSP
jgi:zinc transport system substrate-binding protein